MINVNNYFEFFSPPASNCQIDEWLKDVGQMKFRERLLNGEFLTLPLQDRKVICAFIEKKEILHNTVQTGNQAYTKALIQAGVDPNALNSQGETALTQAESPELFSCLWELGARWIKRNGSLLSHLIYRNTGVWGKEGEKEKWQNILKNLISNFSFQDFLSLSLDNLKDLIRIIKANQEMAPTLAPIVKQAVSENPQKVIEIAKQLMGTLTADEYLNDFLVLLRLSLLNDQTIEGIIFAPRILYWSIQKEKFIAELSQCWQPTSDLEELTQKVGDFRLALFCCAFLRLTTLKDAVYLIKCLELFQAEFASLDPSIKERLVKHIKRLQQKEGQTVWMAIKDSYVSIKDLLTAEQIGFDPNWEDPIHHHTLPFTKLAGSMTVTYLNTSKVNMGHLNDRKENALEYHCRQAHLSEVKSLSELGLRLSANFPFAIRCQELLPDSFYLQVLLVCALMHPNKNFIQNHLLHNLEQKESNLVKAAVNKDSEFKQRIGKYVNPKEFNLPECRQPLFEPAAQLKLEPSIRENRGGEIKYHLEKCASYWDRPIPVSCLELIPESPLASLVISTIQKQAQEKGKITFNALQFLSPLSHDDLVLFVRYLFKHPELSQLLVTKFFQVKKLSIQSGGGCISNHAKFVHFFAQKMNKLLHLPQFLHDLPKWHQKLIDTFSASVTPTFKERLEVPTNVATEMLNRTVIVKTESFYQGFKSLKKGESYSHFSQESTVTQAFRELNSFKSQFHQPLGVYMVRDLSPQLAQYKQVLGDAPYIIYHYQALPQTFEYLQNLSGDQFQEARYRSLHDAVKAARLGIYWDTPLFHNSEQNRHYVVLIDFVIQMSKASILGFSAAGGSGRLDQPFYHSLYSNMRGTGWTDIRDAQLLYRGCLSGQTRELTGVDSDKIDGKYFYQMEALAKILLSDILILVHQYRREQALNWQDEKVLQIFAKELIKGFAWVFAGYSEKTTEECTEFVSQSGINWTRMALQIIFWTDESENGYPTWLAQGKLPEGLYEEQVEVRVDIANAKNLDPLKRFRSNDHQDIGVYNGPLGLTEFEKAAYALLYIPITLAEPLTPPPEPESKRRRSFYYG